MGIPKKGGDFITAGQPFTTEVATFESDDPFATASDFSASIDWGDGNSGSPDLTSATVVQGANDPSTGDPTYFLIGSHTYDTANDAANPAYMFTVFVSTPGAASVASQPTEAVAYAPTLIAQPAPIAGTQGTMLPDDTVVATFTDPEFISDPTTFASGTTANVNWGDGSSDTVNATFAGSSPTGTSFAIEDSHDYADITDVFQAYQVSVTITTPDGSAAVVSDLAVMNVPVLTAQPLVVPAVAGSAFTVPVAAIHTASPQTTAADFAATIQWGDGQSSSGMLQPQAGGTIEVLGSHSYANPGSFPVAITLTDKQGNTVTDTRTATVSDPLIVEALPVSVHLNKMFKGTVARFTDAEPGTAAGNFTVLITWGDETTSDGIVVADGSSSSGATFLVTGSHRYTVKGTFPIKITVVDNSGDQGSATTSVLVGSKAEHGSRPFHRPVARAARLTPSHQPPRLHQRSDSEAMAALVHPGGPLRHFKHS